MCDEPKKATAAKVMSSKPEQNVRYEIQNLMGSGYGMYHYTCMQYIMRAAVCLTKFTFHDDLPVAWFNCSSSFASLVVTISARSRLNKAQ